ncbi:MAG: hypothetical protein ACI82F_004110 [Planctomycetota bacterium]|jgi:hypothetical protein
MPQRDQPPHLPGTPLRGRVLNVGLVSFALAIVFALALFWVYGVHTHHASRSSIWWPERGRNLIPTAATDITLRRDVLDHYATYTVSEEDLNAFLDERFARDGVAIDSFSTRRPVDPVEIGHAIGRLGWVVTEEAVRYHFSARNGGGHAYYHDPKTGRTYQSSAYW